MKRKIDKVFDGQVVASPIRVGTKEWYEWIAKTKSFQFGGADGQCTITRRGKYWYAVKKVNQKFRQEYLGKDSMLTLVRLRGICRIINLDDFVYDLLREELLDYLESRESVYSLESDLYN